MPNRFSSGKFSISQCDRCGFRFKLKKLKSLTIKTKNVNILVCPECWEKDHPQLQLGLYPVNDPQAVRNPRPDFSEYPQSRSYTEVINNGVSLNLYVGELTLTEVFTPVLDLIFTSGSLDSRVTFSRASTATRINSLGILETAAINAPRFDYDPITLAPMGLLIEEQRVNLMLNSSSMSSIQLTAGLRTANSLVAPDGTLSASVINGVGGATPATWTQSATATGTTSTFTVYIKAGLSSSVTSFPLLMRNSTTAVNFTAGAFNTATGVISGTGWSSVNVGNNWYRVSYTNKTSEIISVGNTIVCYMGATGGVIYQSTVALGLWGVQLEAGAFATSYIPTVATQVTRSADVASMTGTNFSSWYNATEGSFFVEFQTLFSSAADVSRGVLGGDATSNKRYFYIGASSDVVASYDGTSISGTSADITGPIAKACSAYNIANRFICSQGNAVQTASVAFGYPATTRIDIGAFGAAGNFLCGYIRRIKYYNIRLPNSELQAITV